MERNERFEEFIEAEQFEKCIACLSARLERDAAIMQAHNAELTSLIQAALRAVKARNFERIGYFAKRLDEWLTSDFIARAKLTDTVTIMMTVSQMHEQANGSD